MILKILNKKWQPSYIFKIDNPILHPNLRNVFSMFENYFNFRNFDFKQGSQGDEKQKKFKGLVAPPNCLVHSNIQQLAIVTTIWGTTLYKESATRKTSYARGRSIHTSLIMKANIKLSKIEVVNKYTLYFKNYVSSNLRCLSDIFVWATRYNSYCC